MLDIRFSMTGIPLIRKDLQRARFKSHCQEAFHIIGNGNEFIMSYFQNKGREAIAVQPPVS